MSVVGSDYDELKQYNLAEIYDPTPRLESMTSNGIAAKMKGKDDSPPTDVAANGAELKNDGLPIAKSQGFKTSLDAQEAADEVHLAAS